MRMFRFVVGDVRQPTLFCCRMSLPAELQYEVARFMGADAKAKDWVLLDKIPLGSVRVPMAKLFAKWVEDRTCDDVFFESSGTREEVSFLLRHGDG
jgi:hypothetical protein